MSMLRRQAIAMIMAVGVFTSCARPRPSAEESVSGTAGAPDARAKMPVLDSRTRGWELGQWHAYRLKLTTTVSFGDDTNVFDFDVSGLVQITPTSVTPDETTLFLALANPKVISRVPRSQ